MNKLKLVQIIKNELEEIKILSQEVAESQKDASLIIDLALNKARLLCQEIELLRELSNMDATSIKENEEDLIEEDDNEVTDVIDSDPELEIINFEEQEFPESEELTFEIEEEYLDDEVEEEEVQEEEDEEDIEEDEPEEDILTEEDEAGDNKEEINEPEMEEDEEEETDDEDFSGTDEFDEREEEESEDEIEDKEPIQKTNIQVVELKSDHQQEVREIHIEDLDEDDMEPISYKPNSVSTDRQVMHEIPKPEVPVQEKLVFGETFQKERSLNDAIGENTNTEPKLTNGPIFSLRAAIGLNDRFLFIREIFRNNTDKYNTVIDQLDKLETIQEAVDYLKANITLEKNDTSLKFVDLLKRRFSK